MPVSEICNRDVVVMRRDETVLDAAKLMREKHVGSVVLVDEQRGRRVPVGIVTDRDLVIEVIAPEVDSRAVSIGDIMAGELASIKENSGVYEAVQHMREKGVRRLPVVDDQGGLIGLVTLDDLLGLLAEEIGALAKLVEREQVNEEEQRPHYGKAA